MLGTLRTFIMGLAVIVAIFSFTLSPAVSADDCSGAANPTAAAQCGINAGANCSTNPKDSNYCPPATKSINNLISTILNILSAVVGIVAIIMIIIAGMRYVTSGGSEQGIKSAKGTLLYAVVGLVIVALSQIIVHFVLNTATNATGDCVKHVNSVTGQAC